MPNHFDHFKIKDEKIVLDVFMKKFVLDRNVSQVIEEDFMIKCFFSDCDDCSMKHGPYGKIISH